MMRYRAHDSEVLNGAGTERVDGVEVFRVQKCTQRGAELQEPWNFIFNGPTPIPAGKIGTGTLDFPALGLHEPKSDRPGSEWGNEWLFAGDECGPVADQWFLSSKYIPDGYWRAGGTNFEFLLHPKGWAFRSLGHQNVWKKFQQTGHKVGDTEQPEVHPIFVVPNYKPTIHPVFYHGVDPSTATVQPGGVFVVGGQTQPFSLQSWGITGFSTFYKMDHPRRAVVACNLSGTIWGANRGEILRIAIEHWRPAWTTGDSFSPMPGDGALGRYLNGAGAMREQDVEQDGYFEDIQIGKENVACSAVFEMQPNDRIYLKNASGVAINCAVSCFTAHELPISPSPNDYSR